MNTDYSRTRKSQSYLQNWFCSRRKSNAKVLQKISDSNVQCQGEASGTRRISRKERDEKRCQAIRRVIDGGISRTNESVCPDAVALAF
jgi:hypothetical protein